MVGENSLKYFVNLLLKLLAKLDRKLGGYPTKLSVLFYNNLRWHRGEYSSLYFYKGAFFLF